MMIKHPFYLSLMMLKNLSMKFFYFIKKIKHIGMIKILFLFLNQLMMLTYHKSNFFLIYLIFFILINFSLLFLYKLYIYNFIFFDSYFFVLLYHRRSRLSPLFAFFSLRFPKSDFISLILRPRPSTLDRKIYSLYIPYQLISAARGVIMGQGSKKIITTIITVILFLLYY
jgi:hypothetical protein